MSNKKRDLTLAEWESVGRLLYVADRSIIAAVQALKETLHASRVEQFHEIQWRLSLLRARVQADCGEQHPECVGPSRMWRGERLVTGDERRDTADSPDRLDRTAS